MPTVLRPGHYRFYFYSHESSEPPHIHAGVPTFRRVSYRAAKLRVTTLCAAKSGRAGQFCKAEPPSPCPTPNKSVFCHFANILKI